MGDLGGQRRLPIVETQEMGRSQEVIHRGEGHDPDELASSVSETGSYEEVG